MLSGRVVISFRRTLLGEGRDKSTLIEEQSCPFGSFSALFTAKHRNSLQTSCRLDSSPVEPNGFELSEVISPVKLLNLPLPAVVAALFNETSNQSFFSHKKNCSTHLSGWFCSSGLKRKESESLTVNLTKACPPWEDVWSSPLWQCLWCVHHYHEMSDLQEVNGWMRSCDHLLFSVSVGLNWTPLLCFKPLWHTSL